MAFVPIRDDDEYGGYKIKLLGHLENIMGPFSVDVVSGDSITPSTINYSYSTIIENKDIIIKSYNFETIIAEKFQTIVVRGLANSRSKDFYDLYILMKLRKDEINIVDLQNAVRVTFNHRETELDKKRIEVVLNLL